MRSSALAFSVHLCALFAALTWTGCDGELHPILGPRCEGASCQSWGDYGASLPIDDCQPGPALMVDTSADEAGDETLTDRASAGERLSLVEALWLASNQSGPHTIAFDSTVFDSDTPATIEIPGERLLPNLEDVCVDARGRGVIVRWPEDAVACFNCGFRLRAGSRLLGATLLQTPVLLRMTGAGVQLAGCRINTDGVTEVDGFGVRGWGAFTFGPGNVGNTHIDVTSLEPGLTTIVGSYFGYDPVADRPLADLGRRGIILAPTTTALITGNAFHGPFGINSDAQELTVTNNTFDGRDPSGAPGGTAVSMGAGGTIGPGNEIMGMAVAVSVGTSAAPVIITANSIHHNEVGIRLAAPLGDLPTVLSASVREVTGTCPAEGTVELFHDAADQGEVFVGEIACVVDTPWVYTAELPEGRNVTATLTTSDGTSSFSSPTSIVP